MRDPFLGNLSIDSPSLRRSDYLVGTGTFLGDPALLLRRTSGEEFLIVRLGAVQRLAIVYAEKSRKGVIYEFLDESNELVKKILSECAI